MLNVLGLAGRELAVGLFGVRLVGLTAENGIKLLLTLGLVVLVWVVGWVSRRLARFLTHGREDVQATFWSSQAINILVTVLFIIGFFSIWFNDPNRLATALGLITAGIAFALQKVITAVAGYYLILRGRLFNVGDRISMGGVRGDVIRVQFIYTTVTEMGQEAHKEMERRYFLRPSDLVPKVYYRLTSNWLELTVRFICHTYNIRALKDTMSRDMIEAFDKAGITIASTTFDIVGFPPVRIQSAEPAPKPQ